METIQDIVIVGGGIAGLSLALALHRVGLRALVLESYDTLRVTGAAFVTWTNAWKALDALGVAHSLRQHHTRLSGGDHEVRCVKRKVLLETLAKELPSNTIRFSSKVVSIEISGFFKLLHLADGSILKTKVLIGCDGVNSVVARFLGFKKPSFTNRLAIRGCVDFEENHGFDSKFLQFMGNGRRYGILPCDATSIYWFFTWSPLHEEDEEIKENPTKLKEFVLNNLGKVQDKIKNVIENTKVEDIICSPLRIRPPWEIIWKDITKDNICITGDALHPMTPDLGQGACSALEDSIVLARHLADGFLKGSEMRDEVEYEKIESCLRKYAKERKWRGIDLITTGYFVGSMQQTSWKFIRFLRDKVFATFLAGLLLKKADFDCGQLNNT
ncbi:monooxygenase 2-like isoform X2 [Silene latifolia]|uniref:monooxygenase 2-like isoform X2 n=1 Tax=Silene latifolia TaxID=37657 RepID=UPI003D7809CF